MSKDVFNFPTLEVIMFKTVTGLTLYNSFFFSRKFSSGFTHGILLNLIFLVDNESWLITFYTNNRCGWINYLQILFFSVTNLFWIPIIETYLSIGKSDNYEFVHEWKTLSGQSSQRSTYNECLCYIFQFIVL